MKKGLIIYCLIFIISISFFFNTIFATEIDNTFLNSNVLLNNAQNVYNEFQEGIKNELAQLDKMNSAIGNYFDNYYQTTSQITPENADYNIKLYIGETYELSVENYAGYKLTHSTEYVQVGNSHSNLVITGLQIGNASGYIYQYPSESNTTDKITKTIYISVVEKEPEKTPIVGVEETLKNVLIIPPSKIKYKVGEKLDLNGLSITEVYNNDEIKQITKGYTIKGYNKDKEGKQTVTISYKGFSRTYNVQVGNSSDIVIEDTENIEKLPQTGDFFDLVDGLYLLIGILSIALISIVYKSTKHKKAEK